MIKRLSIRKKIFLYFTLVFIIFALFVLLFQYEREKEYKKVVLEKKLNNITEIVHKYININSIQKSGKYYLLDSLRRIIPDEGIRITVISPNGTVKYDSEFHDFNKMENHLSRPEVQESVILGYGSNIRQSSTTGYVYYYYAKYYSDKFIRTATIYDIKVEEFLKTENLFVVYIVSLFFILLFILFLITKDIDSTIAKLKDFTEKLNHGEKYDKDIVFPDDEFGIIGKQIINLYDKSNIAKENLALANNKLFTHLQALNEGIAFFSASKKYLFSNKNFILNLNAISDRSTISANRLFDIESLSKLIKFINYNTKQNTQINQNNLPSFEIDVQKAGKYFNVWCTVFQDKNFEIIIRETTKLEKRKLLKQQITSNISHELKTPVTTIMAYLETIKKNNLTVEKQKYFIDKTYAQAFRLSELVEDITVLNKIEESSDLYIFEKLNLSDLIDEIVENNKIRISNNNISVELKISKDIMINANRSLVFSIFYNLFDNAVKYGGENILISIDNYHFDKNHYYFNFSNTGNSVDETHFPRLFERFYRIENGRSRKTGGTGLGLAIVKNAIELHKGEISARNKKNGGMEFLFTLSRSLNN